MPTSMMSSVEYLVLAFLFGIGPLAFLVGADSREDDPRGWWPAVPRRPAPSLPPGGGPAITTRSRRRPSSPARWPRALRLSALDASRP
ncbi:MAG TPA: hypothetical protein VGO86_12045 [Candidatus Dormibacteraeota bacterium]|jgi:hypothetical protein